MKVVDKSTVEYIDHMGSDLSPVNAARVSFNKRKMTFDEADAKLLNYLASHNHWTPFGHAFLSIRVAAPIFVARQLVKHQVGLCWNEVSRRYVDDAPEFASMTWRLAAANVKQGSAGQADADIQRQANEKFWHAIEVCHDAYLGLLELGIAPEQARAVLNLNTMTEWIWSGSLMAFIRVCMLRLDPHAQKETAEVAQQIYLILHDHFPVSVDTWFKNIKV